MKLPELLDALRAFLFSASAESAAWRFLIAFLVAAITAQFFGMDITGTGTAIAIGGLSLAVMLWRLEWPHS